MGKRRPAALRKQLKSIKSMCEKKNNIGFRPGSSGNSGSAEDQTSNDKNTKNQNATRRKRGTCHMQNYQRIAGTSLRKPEGTAFTAKEREQPGLVGLLLDAVENNDQQLEQVLGQLKGKPTDLERYVYLLRLCDRNETLFCKVLLSDRIRFLLTFDCRRSLLEIWLHLPSFARHTHFDPSQGASRGSAASVKRTRWRSFPFMLFLAVACFGFFCQTNTKAQEGGFWGTVLQNNAASYVVRTDGGWLLDAEWDSGYDDWSPGDRVILTTDEGEGYMFNENNRTQVDVFPYDPSEIDF